MRTRTCLRLFVFLGLLQVTVPSHEASANVIVVTTDAVAIAADGQCSLVEALENANAGASPHADCSPGGTSTTVELMPSTTYTVVTAHNATDDGTGLPVIQKPITINGHGATIERSATPGTPSFRIFAVAAAGALTLNDLTIRGGAANADGTGFGGAAILNFGVTVVTGTTLAANQSGTDGGAISNINGTVTLQSCAVTENSTVKAGGGLRNAGGTMTLTDTTVTANHSTGTDNFSRGGGLANQAAAANATMLISGGSISANSTNGVGGAGIDNAAANGRTAALTVQGVVFSDNVANGTEHVAGLGGAIQNSFFRGTQTATATAIVNRSVITRNHAVNGGGISNGFDAVGTYALQLTVTESEISENTASGSGFQVGNGGGIYGVNGATTVANTTVSGNSATGTGSSISGLGGGLMVAGLNGVAASLSAVASTIANNHAATAGGGLFVTPFDGAATARFANAILATNTAPSGNGCAQFGGVIASDGYNLEQGDSCHFSQGTDHPNTAALLGSLMANGASTRTQALLPGSPAIDAGDDVLCAAPPIGGIDQRGVTRPQGARCDIGAFEADWAPTALTLSTAFSLSTGSSGTGRFVLLANQRFVDISGAGGSWWVPQGGTLALVYDTGVACRGLWVAKFTTATQAQGRQFCLDGSGVRGVWSATITP